MQKKIIVSFGVIIIFFGIILLLMGCSNKKEINMPKESIGIIEKSAFTNESYLSFYDDKLKHLKRIQLCEKSVGSVDCKTKKYGNKIIVLSNDLSKKNMDSRLLMIDKKSKKYKYFNSKNCINDMFVEDKIYTISSKYESENISYIEKIAKDLKVEFRLRIRNVILTDIYIKNRYIYATGFSYNKEEISSKLYIIDKDRMNIKKELDISNYVIDVSDMVVIKNKLYIGGRTRRNRYKEEIDNLYLVNMDIHNYSFEREYIGDKVGQFVYKDNRLYFSNYDPVLDEGNTLYIKNMKTNIIKRNGIKDVIRDMVIYRDRLYIIGRKVLYKYKSLEGAIRKDNNRGIEYIGFLRN